MRLHSVLRSASASLFIFVLGTHVATAQDAPRPQTVIDQTNLPQQPIGRQDMLGITVYDEPALTRTVRVNDDGTIRLPMLASTIKVEGLMPAEAEVAIKDQLIEEQLLVDP